MLDQLKSKHKAIKDLVYGDDPFPKIYNELIELVDLIKQVDSNDSESIWAIGECEEFTLDDLIVGSYWFLTEWHAGQWSIEYETLCILGQIFEPGMTNNDKNVVYTALNAAKRRTKMDPNQALKDLREAFESDDFDFEATKEAFEGLDDWLMRGGFLPKDWQNRQKTD